MRHATRRRLVDNAAAEPSATASLLGGRRCRMAPVKARWRSFRRNNRRHECRTFCQAAAGHRLTSALLSSDAAAASWHSTARVTGCMLSTVDVFVLPAELSVPRCCAPLHTERLLNNKHWLPSVCLFVCLLPLLTFRHKKFCGHMYRKARWNSAGFRRRLCLHLPWPWPFDLMSIS